MKNILKSNSGFSMMEVMVGMGMLAVLSYGSMQLFKSITGNQKKMESRAERLNAVSDARNIFRSGIGCEATLAAAGLKKTNAMSGLSIAAIYKDAGNPTIFKTGAKLSASNGISINIGQIRLEPINLNNGEIVIPLSTARKNGSVVDPVVEYKVQLTYYYDLHGNISSCSTDDSLIVNSAAQRVCEDFNASYNTAAQRCEIGAGTGFDLVKMVGDVNNVKSSYGNLIKDYLKLKSSFYKL